MTTISDHAATGSARPGSLRQIQGVTALALHDRLTLVGVVATAMVAMGALTGALWPPLQDTLVGLPADFTDAIGKVLTGANMTTPAGWMNAEMVSLVVPGGLIAVAILSASKAICGEEQTKTVGVLLSLPLSRSAFLTAKTAAMIVHVLLATLGVAAGLIIGDVIGGLGIDASGVFGTCAHSALLAMVFGAVAVLIAALTGDARLAATIPAVLAVIAFALNAFLPLSDSLAGFTKVSPWYYFAGSNPLVNGANYADLSILLVAAIILCACAFPVYIRRDLTG
ncbi:ABC transporter permease subunit [Rhodococcus sp. H36-A4]|uniref:ABC transporter permease subunit n=1 Tax=Rhodococcus sp. H36-A4 TaxID=3004353 RepID=UPI0022AEC222|nr:ABC transporter permease subunit [Rhodococcus sp. H36-A4]MCZ4079952.1 ABC transporter permease subunit [Rhodococcus sp. H36-A4]